MTKYQTRLIEKECRETKDDDDKVIETRYVTEDIKHIVVEADNKREARKKVRQQYPNRKLHPFGRTTITDKLVGVYEIPVKDFKWCHE